MDKNIAIRKADVGDIEQIKAILYSTLKEYKIAIPDNYSVSDIDSIDAKNRSEQVFVLVRYAAVIGFIVLIPNAKDGVEFRRLYLTSLERGQKLGEYLLNYAINFAHLKHYKYIRLETTSKFKEAVSLYKKHGFVILEEVETAPGQDVAFIKEFKFSSYIRRTRFARR
jgi:GNAT superfamily N-acetyltransferase